MIHHNLLLILALFFAMALLFMLSQRLKISYPIFLVIGGLGISFIPGLPQLNVNPELVFLIFLPPLLFEAAAINIKPRFWTDAVYFAGHCLFFCTYYSRLYVCTLNGQKMCYLMYL